MTEILNRRRALMASSAEPSSITGEFGTVFVERQTVGANNVSNTTEAFQYLRNLRTSQSGYLLAAYRASDSPAPVTNEIGNIICYANINGSAYLRCWHWSSSQWNQADITSIPTNPSAAKLSEGSVYYLVQYQPA